MYVCTYVALRMHIKRNKCELLFCKFTNMWMDMDMDIDMDMDMDMDIDMDMDQQLPSVCSPTEAPF